jgi:hypothetical protein
MLIHAAAAQHKPSAILARRVIGDKLLARRFRIVMEYAEPTTELLVSCQDHGVAILEDVQHNAIPKGQDLEESPAEFCFIAAVVELRHRAT